MAASVPVMVVAIIMGVLMGMSLSLVAVLMAVMTMRLRFMRMLMLMLVLVVAAHRSSLLSLLYLFILISWPYSCQGLDSVFAGATKTIS